MALREDAFLRVYSISVFLYLLHSMHPWFLLWLPAIWASLLFLLISFAAIQRNYFIFKKRSTSAFLFFILYIWIKRDANVNGFIEAFVNSIIFATILSLRRNILIYLFEKITKWMAILLGISGFAFLLNMFGFPLPHSPLSADGAFGSLETENYYFFINAASFTELGRFRGVFYEPGYLTLGVAALLYLNKYDIHNKYVVILLFTQMLSFSLAGFILLAFGFLFCSICNTQSKGKKSILSGTLVILLSFYILSIVFGDAYMQDTLFSRLEWVDGDIAGNNRSSLYLDFVYENMMSTAEMWTGTNFNIEYSEKGVSGYKLFAVQNGLIGVILSIISFYSLIPSKKRYSVNFMHGAIILILLILYQNAYPTAFCILFPAACIMYINEE